MDLIHEVYNDNENDDDDDDDDVVSRNEYLVLGAM
jgi:hypothetical protein